MQLIRCFLCLILYGILCNQVCEWSYPCPHILGCPLLTSFKDIYYISFPKDNLASKMVIYLLWLTKTVQIVSNTIDTFDMFCTNFANISGLDDIRLTWFNNNILAGFGAYLCRYIMLWVIKIMVVGCIAQLSYAWRMYKFSKKAQWLCITISVVRFSKNVLYPSLKPRSSSKIAFTQFTAAICCSIQVQNTGHYSKLQKNSKIVVTAIVSRTSSCPVINHLRLADMVGWKRFVWYCHCSLHDLPHKWSRGIALKSWLIVATCS